MRGKSDTLHLVLKGKWYDMIESGEKREEYREIKPYWIERIFEESSCLPKDSELHDFFIKCGKYHGIYRPKVRRVVFHRAYTNTTLEYQIGGIAIGKPNPKWCEAEDADKEFIIIKLGDRVSNGRSD